MKASVLTAIFTFLLKLITLLGFLIGLGFIIFGCVLETPPKTAIPAALVVVGVVTILSSLLGYAGSQFKPQLLLAYLIVGAAGAVAQLIIVLAIFFAQPEVATAIENMNSQGSVTAAYIKEKDRFVYFILLKANTVYVGLQSTSSYGEGAPKEFIYEKLEIGKWIFLWVVLGEVASLTLALVMRLMGSVEGKYENMDLEEVNRLHDVELQGITKSMTSQQKVTNKNEDRLAAKMQKKYGRSSGIDFMEGRRWYNIGR